MRKVVATTTNEIISMPTTMKELVTTKYLTSQSTTRTTLMLQTETTSVKQYTSRCHKNVTLTAKSTSTSSGRHRNSTERNHSGHLISVTSTAISTSTSSGIQRNSTQRNHSEHLMTSNSSYFPPFMKCLYFIVFIRGTLWHNLFGMKTKI